MSIFCVKIADLHRKYTDYEWDLDSKEIFSSIYTFIARNKDLQEICEAMMIFGRYTVYKKYTTVVI